MGMVLVGNRELILYTGLVPERWGSGKFPLGHFGSEMTAGGHFGSEMTARW